MSEALVSKRTPRATDNLVPILQVDKYTYSVCPFKDAFQKEGSSKTSLGTWAGLADGSSVMKFTGGQACWQGPARSMTVRPASTYTHAHASTHARTHAQRVQHDCGVSSKACSSACAVVLNQCLVTSSSINLRFRNKLPVGQSKLRLA